ncbi:MAG: acetylxylan esterase [Verrucomicrobiota bacterium]
MKALLVCLIALCFFGSGRGEPVTLHDYHPFRKELAEEDWSERRRAIRTRTLVSAGLLPEPKRPQSEPLISPPTDHDGFQIYRVAVESFQGHWVTGNLFTPPEGFRGEQNRPGVLCPHGHWKDGRFYDLATHRGEQAVRNELAIGAERFETAARNPILARCVQLARMGCIVFVYDMIGYADSVQFADHRRGPREHMTGENEWGFASPESTLRLQTLFGLQTWNSVRALDFLESLEAVDPERILVTGASGGGTQTMVLAAIDDRVDAAFPCVMPSTAMQGGCPCENSHLLRIDQGNIDLAAATAPRPLGITSADDWTIEFETKGHPDLVDLYRRLKAPTAYEAHFNTHFKHNYNHVSRAQMYAFVNRHFDLGFAEPILEQHFDWLDREMLTVWPNQTRPPNYQVGEEHERALHRDWAEHSDAEVESAFAGFASGDSSSFNKIVAGGWGVILRRPSIEVEAAELELGEKTATADGYDFSGTIRYEDVALDVKMHYPSQWNQSVSIQAGPFDNVSHKNGTAVIYLPGHAAGDYLPMASTYSGKTDLAPDSWQRQSVYFYGYNDSVLTRRVRDLVAAVRMVQNHPDWDVSEIEICGQGFGGAVALAAGWILSGEIKRVTVDSAGLNFDSVESDWATEMVPGAVRYGGMRGLAFLNAPCSVKWIGDESWLDQLATSYQQLGAADQFEQVGR